MGICGIGTNALNQIGWTIVGGLFFGTLFSLFFAPSLYVWFCGLNYKNNTIAKNI